jgi:hypothetical protein
MATSILELGLTEENSAEFTVEDCKFAILSVFTEDGSDMPIGPVLIVQRQDINGNFISLATVGNGNVFLMAGSQQAAIRLPGTYRVHRPDISVWNAPIGVSLGV